MKNLAKLKEVSPELAEQCLERQQLKKRFFRVQVDVKTVQAERIVVHAHQYSLFPGRVWSPKHLYEMAKEVMEPFEQDGYAISVKVSIYDGPPDEHFGPEGVKYFLDRHGIKQRELAGMLGTNEQQVSKLLKGQPEMTAHARAACYYLIQWAYAKKLFN